ncbi:hypothetical protein WPS_35260 [Vulcanimicrobium alpinum]|uniref:DUF190 domain-containing protein n=1 Tax=Vulcanimicrobium alpinum TaxID=3016050 RepID=A0AAN2CB37_UNVUL|nr:DUF190 domain-containing protein [Vulcanimicrobium alpinum]BDE08250.1 hypothetical protein WPS_35260 [Vulcanimicrobium alpinum]
MKIEHNGMLVRIYFSESAHHEHSDTLGLIIAALSKAGFVGASVFKGIEGYGSHRYISSASIIDAYVDLPILIEVVDDEEKVRSFIPTLETILEDGLVTLERVQTLFYRGTPVCG